MKSLEDFKKIFEEMGKKTISYPGLNFIHVKLGIKYRRVNLEEAAKLIQDLSADEE